MPHTCHEDPDAHAHQKGQQFLIYFNTQSHNHPNRLVWNWSPHSYPNKILFDSMKLNMNEQPHTVQVKAAKDLPECTTLNY